MPQQINLLDARPQRKREALGSVTGLIAIVATLGLSAALAFTLQTFSAQKQAQAAVLEQELAALQTRVAGVGSAAPSRQVVELARLRSVDAGQRRLRAALDSGEAGGTQGYSEFFLALSRQTQGTLWLTGFTVGADGRSIELGGRMTDPRQLPDYLRRLNSEPLFKGREFAQLSLKAVEPGEASGSSAGYAEFALRTSAGVAEAPR